ncbi:ABC transporter G family member 23-like isoform X2 [Brevipalpus obovatus]|uniref:ABC transporter G family member 23-like isoform X2 n=1 Tax=Brevipalpus obovatus TaxID=246614 RepID=UPI003D9E14BD
MSYSGSPNGLSVRGLYYSNGTEEILRDVNLYVPKGTIFGLLGPSGCGKTTLLRCVVGTLRPQHGAISIFGQLPGRDTAKIPGSGIGYMPQENALYENMTIEELLKYYGKVFLMPSKILGDRIKNLLEVLELPDKCQKVAKLSGGQKRRVSFAVALIHRPGLLILDEPTSGVDPLLREKIWQHLLYISSHQGATIIITTHYIEEARRSQNVSFMRRGRLLVQENPTKLLSDLKVSTLEDAFLEICVNQNRVASIHEQEKVPYISAHSDNFFSTKHKTRKQIVTDWFAVFFTVLWKHLICDLREPLTIGFQYIIPITQIMLFALCIGGQPFGIPLGIVNSESDSDLGNYFVQGLDPHLFRTQNYTALEEAMDAARNREIWGILHIPNQFSQAITDLLYHPEESRFIEQAHIRLHADLTDKVISQTMLRYLDDYSVDFVGDVIRSDAKDKKKIQISQFIANLPIKMGDPIYGQLEKKNYRGLRDFMLPGLIVNITYAIAYSLTALSLITERKGQTFERNYVAGVKPSQMLLAHAISRIVMMVSYLFLIIYLPVVAFNMPVDTSHTIYSLPLLLALNFSGMTYGMCISSLCESIEMGSVFAAATLFIILFMSGTIWPIESVPGYFRWVCQAAPTTAATEALRNVWYKKWPITSPQVAGTYGITFGWTFAFFVVGLRLFRLNK